jgi:hypothetical protein
MGQSARIEPSSVGNFASREALVPVPPRMFFELFRRHTSCSNETRTSGRARRTTTAIPAWRAGKDSWQIRQGGDGAARTLAVGEHYVIAVGEQLPSVVVADRASYAITAAQLVTPGATTISNVRHGDVQHGTAHQSRKSSRRRNRSSGGHRACVGRCDLRGVRGQCSATARTYGRPARPTTRRTMKNVTPNPSARDAF